MSLVPVLTPPWLLIDLGAPHFVAGWPIVGPAWGTARHIAWLQVRDRDLPPGRDPEGYFRQQAESAGIQAEIGLMTAAEIAGFRCCRAESDGLAVEIVVTAGLTNGESVQPGTDSVDTPWHAGTVNSLLTVTTGLSEAAMLEAIAIVTQARTAAIMDLGLSLTDGRRLTGTGTDCVLVAAPKHAVPEHHCGLHTQLGRMIGQTSYRAFQAAITPL
jgi:adenosylcobinamide amidohydrolase